MAITLQPATETRLREKAARAGLDMDTLADSLLTDALTDDPDDLTSDEIAEIRAGIRRGFEAAVAGRERPVAEYMAEVQQRQAARQGEKR